MKAAAIHGRTLVGTSVYRRMLSAGDLAARVKTGLPVREFDALRELLGLTTAALAEKVGISLATLSRRRQRRDVLDPGHGDRVLRFARLFRLAVALYDGDEHAARTWLTTPARALDGQTPLDFADTEAGAREVEQLIGRLEHSVYT
jgi:putative toxin-antitoxin system antitoxin component (TIGR02293 family)